MLLLLLFFTYLHCHYNNNNNNNNNNYYYNSKATRPMMVMTIMTMPFDWSMLVAIRRKQDDLSVSSVISVLRRLAAESPGTERERGRERNRRIAGLDLAELHDDDESRLLPDADRRASPAAIGQEMPECSESWPASLSGNHPAHVARYCSIVL